MAAGPTIDERRKRDEQAAQQAVEWFVAQHDESYRSLAYYAAMPLLLTPELLNYLRNRFLGGRTPWEAEVDLLLSDLCRPIDYELFALVPAVRAYLLGEMRRAVGVDEMQRVARTLIHYVQHLARTNPYLDDHELQAQQWAAMVYLSDQRPQAAREIAQALRRAAGTDAPANAVDTSYVDRAEMARLARFTEQLAPELQEHQELVDYAALISRLLAGIADRAAPAQRAYTATVEGVVLTVPDSLVVEERRVTPPPEEPEGGMTAGSLSFTVTVESAERGEYMVRVPRSPAGELGPTPMRFMRELVESRRYGKTLDEEPMRIGQELFDTLLGQPDVFDLFGRSRALAEASNSVLRLELDLRSPELQALPWELLYSPAQDEFLALEPNFSVIRYSARPTPPVRVSTGPLRILGVSAAPAELPGLDVSRARANLEQALAEAMRRKQIELVWLERASLRSLADELARNAYHVLYYAGHVQGAPEGEEARLVLEREDGLVQAVDASAIGKLLAGRRSPRLVVLNVDAAAQRGGPAAAAGSLAAALVRMGAGAVLTVQGPLGDRAAAEFAAGLYPALADGLPVERALGAARRAVHRSDPRSADWAVPVLYAGDATGALLYAGEAPAAEAAPRPPIEFDWVTVPAGEFIMGSDKKKDERAFDYETPQHKLYLSEYRIARVPVTVAQFAAFVQATGYRTTAEEQGSAFVYTGSKWEDVKGANWSHPRGPKSDVRQKQDHPVTCVSWRDAQAFCQWAGVRLPTEAEWEKAARGTDGRIYPWGDDAPTKELCNFNMNVKDTTPVGNYPRGASPYGVLDMAGNVWEWTSSLYQPYPYDVADGRENPEAGGRRTLRGGSWNYTELDVRCAPRDVSYPDLRYDDFGFRVVTP